jgi:dCMP deaminase
MKPKFIDLFMDIAERVSQMSSATRLKVGSIVVKDDRIISLGYNGTIKDWHTNDCEDENNKTTPEVIHAEENALMKLASTNESGKGATIFVTHSCCINCAKLIYGSGITTVYYKVEYKSLDGIEFLRKCGITCIQHK